MKRLGLLILGLLLISANAYAGETDGMSWWEKLKYNISQTWKKPDNYDLYVPAYAWHARYAYDNEHLEKYNEHPWGLGAGLSRYDSDGDWHSLAAMGFKDSNRYFESMFAYSFQKNWYYKNTPWHAGVGFSMGLTQRHEYSYIPAPLILPLFGAGHKNFELQMVYVPGVKNDGNVAFIWLRMSF